MSRFQANSLPRESTAPFAEGGLFGLIQGLAAMLLVARLLYPPESSILGGTLGITQAWMGLVILWAWDAFRRYDSRLRLGAVDAAVWLVVLGHGLSSISAWQGQGDLRAALNGFWEWVGLGGCFFVLRQMVRTKSDCLRLMGILTFAAVMLASFGIWQHYVELPKIAAEYERINQQLKAPTSIAEAARLQRELMQMGVPTDPVSRTLWENRLKSTEPFATFALANTLAGFLAAWLFVSLDAARFRALSSGRELGKWVCLLAILFCVVLTKSRTAWVGLLAGGLAWTFLFRGKASQSSRRFVMGVGIIAGVAVLFFLVAALSGGFDRQVISEAPKSLAYRLQYWAGAWDVVQSQPWLGTGPGNFRPYYLQFKLPESSEEIADPHNWLLDLWTSGGLLAVVGFLLVLGIAVRHGWRLLPENSQQKMAETPQASDRASCWEIGAMGAFPVVIGVRWMSGEPFATELLGLMFLWAIAWFFLRTNASANLPIAGIFAGGLALLVHLLGAGGIEMPAIPQTLLVLVVVLCWQDWGQALESPPRLSVQKSPFKIFAFSLLSLAAFIGCAMTATIPVWYRLLHESNGFAFHGQGDFQRAVRSYELADEADPYSPEPVSRLAELAFQTWQASGQDSDFEQAVRYGLLAINRDPVTYSGYRRLGHWHFERAERLASEEEARIAVEWFSKAVARYPHYAPLRAELALAHHLAGQDQQAAEEAGTALKLDQINRQAGHREKYLPEAVLQNLKSMQIQ